MKLLNFKSIHYPELATCALLGTNFVKDPILKTIRLVINLPNSLDTALYYVVLFYFVFRALFIKSKLDTRDIFIIFTFLAVNIFISMAIKKSEWTYEIIWNLTVCFLAYITTRKIRNVEVFVKYLRFLAIVMLIFALISFKFGFWIDDMLGYLAKNMFVSYSYLPATLIFAHATFYSNKLKFLYIIFYVISIIIHFLLQTRGPLLIALGFFILLALVNFNIKKYILPLSVLSVIIIIGGAQIISFGDEAAEGNNVILKYFNSNDALQSQGRNEIREHCIKSILDNPFGLGLAQDRYVVGETHDAGKASRDSYPHLIVLEILMQYGVILGSVLLLYLLWLFYKVYTHPISREWTQVIAIFAFCGFVPLFLSGSYLNWIPFWIFFGLLVSNLKRSKKKIYRKKSSHNEILLVKCNNISNE